ncbi:N-alpha-acetyltransferase 30 [Geosmithia morbida]|uniref:N-alpha-acetyltransferase 30 n=1 Tax=Geosmithia morbida TaxID=1094350 RepID=A0A9P4YZJ1_9HYPO|nr:N-alpha-acetyltransferase 30 [Geosmithia morbida]KAF4125805.1 N-alpha-acetyltransferase 30 [Geosmithia morbida]
MFRAAPRRAVWEDVLSKLFAGQAKKLSSSAGALHQGAAAQRATLGGGSRYATSRPFATARQTIFRGRQQQQQQAKRWFRSSAWRAGAQAGQEGLSMGQKLKKLTKDYGKAAVVVYFMLSAIDLSLFYLLVRMAGTDRIGRVEEAIVSVIPEPIRVKTGQAWAAIKSVLKKDDGETEKKEGAGEDTTVLGVETATEGHREEASLATQFALAYALHKSIIFLRIPLTAVVTPKVVKTLASWGWNIGKSLKKTS